MIKGPLSHCGTLRQVLHVCCQTPRAGQRSFVCWCTFRSWEWPGNKTTSAQGTFWTKGRQFHKPVSDPSCRQGTGGWRISALTMTMTMTIAMTMTRDFPTLSLQPPSDQKNQTTWTNNLKTVDSSESNYKKNQSRW